MICPLNSPHYLSFLIYDPSAYYRPPPAPRQVPESLQPHFHWKAFMFSYCWYAWKVLPPDFEGPSILAFFRLCSNASSSGRTSLSTLNETVFNLLYFCHRVTDTWQLIHDLSDNCSPPLEYKLHEWGLCFLSLSLLFNLFPLPYMK